MAISMRILGVPKAIAFLDTKKRGIADGITDGTINAADNLKAEVKASINGERAEPRSVKTGNFLNSINIMTSKDSASVVSEVPYAKFLEYGTSRGIKERRHFRNSMSRNRNKIIDDVAQSVKTNI